MEWKAWGVNICFRSCVAKLQHDAACVLRKFHIFISSHRARLQHDASTKEIQSIYHVIESNEVRGRGFRQGNGSNTVAGLGLIGAAAGSERAGCDQDSGPGPRCGLHAGLIRPRLGPIGSVCGSEFCFPFPKTHVAASFRPGQMSTSMQATRVFLWYSWRCSDVFPP